MAQEPKHVTTRQPKSNGSRQTGCNNDVEILTRDWSSDVCSSDLVAGPKQIWVAVGNLVISR